MEENNNKWFFNKSLNKKCEEFYQQNLEKNDIEYENDFEKKLAFATSVLFDNNGMSEVEQNNQGLISKKYILDEENDLNVVYYDSKNENKHHTVVLIKYLNIDNIDDLNYEEDINPTLNYFVSIIENWSKQNNGENIEETTSKLTREVVDKIEDIFNYLEDDSLKDLEGKVKKSKISFRLVFIIGNLSEYKQKIKNKIHQLKTEISYSKNSYVNNINKHHVDLYFEDDIFKNVKKTSNNDLFVDFGELEIDQPNNKLEYSNNSDSSYVEKSIVVNLSAKSIYKLWKEKDNQLLGMNIRFYVKNKNTDDKIKNSMLNKNNKEFWIKNNGLVILCKHYELKGKKLELENFSIVNGGQTTYNIGNFKNFDKSDQEDFFVLSKIISIKNIEINDNNVIEFANSIAEATNTQKPIKKQDLLSSNKELKKAKIFLENKNIFLLVKKGEPKNYEIQEIIKKDKWRNLEYSKVLQVSAAFYDIRPGTARSGKAKLIDETKIEEVFGKNVIYDFETFKDLMKFNYIVSKLDTKKKLEKEDFYGDKFEADRYEKFVKYGKFFSISFLRIIKIFLEIPESKNEYEAIIKSSSFSDSEKQKEITKWSNKWWNLIDNKKIFNEEDINVIENYWKKIIRNIIGADFVEAIDKMGQGPSNFTKNNKSFYEHFMKSVLYRFNDNRSRYSEIILISGPKKDSSKLNDIEQDKIFLFQKAKIKYIDDSNEVILLKNSIIPKLETKKENSISYDEKIEYKIEKWIKENIYYLENNGDSYIVSEDIRINSPTLASEIVSNKIAVYSGPSVWKNEKGQTLKEYSNHNYE